MGNKNSGKWLYKDMSDQEVVMRNIELKGCWIWIGNMDAYGYGAISRNRILKKAHRFSYEAFKGKIKDNLTIDHLCRNRACVNPEHLEAVSLAENKSRGNSPAAINARKTHCNKGHELSGSNLKVYIRAYGKRRYCVTCQKSSDAIRNRNTPKGSK